jgi:hypothetical protein
MRVSALDVRAWPREDVPGLGLIDGDVGLLRGELWHPGSRINRIDRILIPLRYIFFSRNPTIKNSEAKCV